jgi:mono/diheme cytochrome c family protein
MGDSRRRWGLRAGWSIGLGLLLAVGLVAVAGFVGVGSSVASSSFPASTPSPTFTHPTPMVTTALGDTVDVTQCYFCHSDKYTQWQNSSPYSSGVYGELKGHNLTLADAYLSSDHNSSELLVSDCQHCMSPFSTRVFGGATTPPVDFSAYVQPIDTTGPWALTPPYDAAQSGGAHPGYFLPKDHVSYSPAPGDPVGGAFEGVSCRVCHDTTNLVQKGADLLPSSAWFNGDTWAYEAVPQNDTNQLCQKCHATDDSRTPPAGSVHAGLQCIDCHMNNYLGQNGDFNHTFSAGLPTDAFSQTACAQIGCHANGVHPLVTTLETSFKSAEMYPANQPTDDLGALVTSVDGLLYDPAARQNIHAVTCDTCHQPSGVKASYIITYGSKLTIKGYRIDKTTIPQSATTGIVSMWWRPKASTDVFTWVDQVGADNSAPKTAFAFTTWMPAENAKVYITQGLQGSLHGFPGMGRGPLATVSVRAKVTLTLSKTLVHRGAVVTLTGKCLPGKAGKMVTIQRSRNGTTWTTWKTVTLSLTSAYSAKWTAPATKGHYYFRTHFAGDSTNLAGTSPKRLVTVY